MIQCDLNSLLSHTITAVVLIFLAIVNIILSGYYFSIHDVGSYAYTMSNFMSSAVLFYSFTTVIWLAKEQRYMMNRGLPRGHDSRSPYTNAVSKSALISILFTSYLLLLFKLSVADSRIITQPTVSMLEENGMKMYSGEICVPSNCQFLEIDWCYSHDHDSECTSNANDPSFHVNGKDFTYSYNNSKAVGNILYAKANVHCKHLDLREQIVNLTGYGQDGVCDPAKPINTAIVITVVVLPLLIMWCCLFFMKRSKNVPLLDLEQGLSDEV